GAARVPHADAQVPSRSSHLVAGKTKGGERDYAEAHRLVQAAGKAAAALTAPERQPGFATAILVVRHPRSRVITPRVVGRFGPMLRPHVSKRRSPPMQNKN